MPLAPNEFQCKLCGGVFTKARSDEEALEEYNNVFLEREGRDVRPEDEREVVCAECYQLIMGM